MDAYEFSFVAVPAQREAGVIKGLGRRNVTLKALAEEFGVQAEYRELYKQAQLGQLYEQELRNEVVRLCMVLDLGATETVLRSVMEKAGSEDLRKLKAALEERARMLMPMQTQLPGKVTALEAVDSGFLI